MNTEEKKIAVIGIGGVGGYIAGMLAKAYPHVTMVARGARAESIRKNGLVLHSDYKGEIVARPERVASVREMGQQDYIFICVKNYSLAEVCESIRDMVTDDTVIIPVMNGVDPGENIRRLVGKGTVVDSLIYTVAFANEDFSIAQQDTFTWLCIGIKDADERQQKKIAEVTEILKGADNATSSLQRDFRIRRKQTELETFSGYIVKEAKKLGVSIPLSEKIYQGLMEMAEKF